MRKNRIFFHVISMLLASSIFHVSATQITTEIDLSVITDTQFTLVYNEGQPNAFQVTGEGIERYNFTFNALHMASCGITPPFPTLPLWQMKGRTENGIDISGSAWIEITCLEGASLVALEIQGLAGSNNGSSFIAGFSEEANGDAYTDGIFCDYPLPSQCASPAIVFPQGKEIRSIRLERSTAFAGQQTNTLPGMVNIKDISVTLSYLPTGAEVAQPSGLNIELYGNHISSTVNCLMEVYTPAGMLLKSQENTQFLSTEEFEKGIYLVKATQGKETKIIRLLK
ncbi:MAG: T9SS type A sorting domain-containing protein [Candidatus Azobacteroides sp.]|nr:T9SS type A sorting domain-containing protein [Candidatus Azobacteroides sp.]